MSSKDSQGSLCMICLGEGAQPQQQVCGCQILIHDKCHKEHLKTKDPKCLICRQATPYQFGSLTDDQRERDKRHNSCILCCCCCLSVEFFLQFL